MNVWCQGPSEIGDPLSPCIRLVEGTTIRGIETRGGHLRE